MKSDFYEKCYDLLVAKVKAPEGQRSGFVSYFASHRRPLEWRFGGIFGLWGYFYCDGFSGAQHYITAPETKEPQLLKLVEEVNKDLKELETSWVKE